MKNAEHRQKAPVFAVELFNVRTGEKETFSGMLSKYMAKNAANRLKAKYGDDYTTTIREVKT